MGEGARGREERGGAMQKTHDDIPIGHDAGGRCAGVARRQLRGAGGGNGAMVAGFGRISDGFNLLLTASRWGCRLSWLSVLFLCCPGGRADDGPRRRGGGGRGWGGPERGGGGADQGWGVAEKVGVSLAEGVRGVLTHPLSRSTPFPCQMRGVCHLGCMERVGGTGKVGGVCLGIWA